MNWVYHDGGRAAAGYKGKANDCVARAIAIVTSKPYDEVCIDLNSFATLERPRNGRKRSSSNKGVRKQTYKRYLLQLGAKWNPTMFIGSGCKVHLKDGELPMGRLIVEVSRHVVAVIDGVVYDNHDPSRDGNRCVYGYYTF